MSPWRWKVKAMRAPHSDFHTLQKGGSGLVCTYRHSPLPIPFNHHHHHNHNHPSLSLCPPSLYYKRSPTIVVLSNVRPNSEQAPFTFGGLPYLYKRHVHSLLSLILWCVVVDSELWKYNHFNVFTWHSLTNSTNKTTRIRRDYFFSTTTQHNYAPPTSDLEVLSVIKGDLFRPSCPPLPRVGRQGSGDACYAGLVASPTKFTYEVLAWLSKSTNKRQSGEVGGGRAPDTTPSPPTTPHPHKTPNFLFGRTSKLTYDRKWYLEKQHKHSEFFFFNFFYFFSSTP